MLTVVSANRHGEDVRRLVDGTVETAWGSGNSQIGDEVLAVDLGSAQSVGAAIFDMGSYAFGFPRQLEVDVSLDGGRWMPAWSGRTAVLTVRAGIAEPGVVPLVVDLGRVRARFLRFRQTGSEPGIPWWIAELHVHAPPEPAAGR